MILDFSVPFDDRANAFVEMEDVGDIVSSLMFTYTVSASSDAGSFLLWIARNDRVAPSVRFECAKSLVENAGRFSDMSADAFDAIDTLCMLPESFLFYQSTTMYLMMSKKHRYSARRHLMSLICRSDTEMRIRYAAVLGISSVGLSEKMVRYFTVTGLKCVIFNTDNIMYRLMAAQHALDVTSGVSGKMYTSFADDVAMFVVDTSLTHADYNTRADAADILLSSGDPSLVQIGQDVIDELSGSNGTYFTNDQNVHIKSIEESCVRNLEQLMTHTFVVKDLESSLREFRKSFTNTDSIELAIERIEGDRAVYTSLRLTLSSIFCRVWAYIRRNNSRDAMCTRLYEELEDSVGVCSSGFMARIVNALSGFDGFNVGISFEDQIAAYLSSSITRLIQDSSEISEILDDMTEGDGAALREFVVENLSKVREEMHAEFRDYISDTDFDVYFKKAFTRYFC